MLIDSNDVYCSIDASDEWASTLFTLRLSVWGKQTLGAQHDSFLLSSNLKKIKTKNKKTKQ